MKESKEEAAAARRAERDRKMALAVKELAEPWTLVDLMKKAHVGHFDAWLFLLSLKINNLVEVRGYEPNAQYCLTEKFSTVTLAAR